MIFESMVLEIHFQKQELQSALHVVQLFVHFHDNDDIHLEFGYERFNLHNSTSFPLNLL